jgi:hypothetical protein
LVAACRGWTLCSLLGLSNREGRIGLLALRRESGAQVLQLTLGLPRPAREAAHREAERGALPCHPVTALRVILRSGPDATGFIEQDTFWMNTYEATIKLPGGGLQKVQLQANSWAHARDLLTMQYGAGNFMNLHQKS